MVTVDVQGVEQVAAALRRLTVTVPAAAVQAMQQEAERILDQSRELVPVDTGLLLSTGLLEPLHNGAQISYGGKGLAPYAAVVHYRTDVYHPNGQSHFLSQPVFAATADMPQRLAAFLEGRLSSL